MKDTYRTLTAVDSVIVVIDVAKGVETQTEKLVEVCRMRKIPMLVFINKLDREGKDAFWFARWSGAKTRFKSGSAFASDWYGKWFQGIYNIWEKNIQLFLEEKETESWESLVIEDINDKSRWYHREKKRRAFYVMN